MHTDELYYLIMVCAAFGLFGLAMAVSYVQYRSWLKQQPDARH